MPVSRKRRTKRPSRVATPDPRSYPDTSLSPNTYEGRVQAFGNVLRAAKYGQGRRRQAASVLVGILVLMLVASVVMAVAQFL